MADTAPQVSPPASPVPPAAPAAPEPIPASPPAAAPEPVTNEPPAAPTAVADPAAEKLKEDEEAKEKEQEKEREKEAQEKEAHEKELKDAAVPTPLPPEAGAPITRTFTTHAGETVAVMELPSVANNADLPATVPMADQTVVKKEVTTEPVPPLKAVATPVPPEPAAPITRDFTTNARALPETDSPVDRDVTASTVPQDNTKAETKIEKVAPAPQLPVLEAGYEVGILPQYIAKVETTLLHSGMTSQTFTDERGTSVFTLDRRPGGRFEDKELRDMTRMYIFGIHRRRFRRPRQW